MSYRVIWSLKRGRINEPVSDWDESQFAFADEYFRSMVQGERDKPLTSREYFQEELGRRSLRGKQRLA